jgi:hypothetical protein
VSLTRPKNPVRVAIVAGILLVAVNVAIWGGRSQQNGPAAVQRPEAIVDLHPAEGLGIIPQDFVGAQLRPQYTGQLTIDGNVVPQDQLTGAATLNQYFFEPGPGKDVREFAKGRHSAVIEWWPKTISSYEQAKAQQRVGTYSWTFNVG